MKEETLFRELKKKALDACHYRGHRMGRFWSWPNSPHLCGQASCLDCGETAVVDTDPLPNSFSLCGPALTVMCVSKKNSTDSA